MPTPAVIPSRKLRFAVVGCGRIAQNHFAALRQHAARAELVAVCDTHAPSLDAAVASTGVV
ncbi:MAG TPA: Gfo/Idh/MocA family oxidoreductase, partial [Burkholderiaceae bacterium]